jgi:UDP-glucose 4-epimerase
LKNLKLLVTGGAGFIGSHLVDALVKRGDSVRILDNLSTGKLENVAAVKNDIEFQKGDLTRGHDLERAVRGIDVVFHQGALRSVPRSVDDPTSTNRVNIDSTLALLVAAKKARVKRVVYASSSSVYGDAKHFPQSEILPTSPLSPYAVSKLAGELYCRIFAKTYGLETVCLRYFNVFGPRQHPESQYAAVIPLFMKSARDGKILEVHWDGRQARDFTYVDNVVLANLLAAKAKGVSGDYFNIACGRSASLLRIIRGIEKLIGHPTRRHHSPKRAGDVRKTWADIHKARRLLGYAPIVGLEEGLGRTWAWFNR